MNKAKKILSLLVAYVMLLTVLPVATLASENNKAGEIPQYLNYDGGHCMATSLYKDKALIAEMLIEDNSDCENYEQNGYSLRKVLNLVSGNNKTKIRNMDEFYFVQSRTALSKKAEFVCGAIHDGYLFSYDFETEKSDLKDMYYEPHIPFDDFAKCVREKYNLDEKCEIEQDMCPNLFDSQGNELATIQVHTVENDLYNTYMGFLVNGKVKVLKIRMNEDEESWNDNSNFYHKTIFFEGNKLYALTYDYKTGESCISSISDNKIYEKIGNIASMSAILAIIDNKAYVYDYVEESLNVYELNENKCKIKNTIHLNDREGFAVDINNNIWMIQNENGRAYVCKLKNGNFIRKYEVNPNMTSLKVYDDNNLLVMSPYGYTHITGASVSDGDNDNKEDGNEVIVKPDKSETKGDTTKVEVGTLTPGSTNVVEATVGNNVEVTLKDIDVIKDNEGIVAIKLNDGSKVNIPFSVLDSKMLENAKEVKIEFTAKEDNTLTDGLKAVNKVFNFDLTVIKEDGTLSVHNFADGEAEITLSLTDDELQGLDRSKLVVLYYNEETKKYEEMETVVDGNNVTFKTTHFSKFIVAEKESKSDEEKEDNNVSGGESTTKPEDNKKPTVNDGTTNNGSTNSGITSASGNGTNNGDTNKKPNNKVNKLTQTGTAASTSALSVLGLVLSAVGTVLFIRRR